MWESCHVNSPFRKRPSDTYRGFVFPILSNLLVPMLYCVETGNMLIMALSYTQRSGDNSLVTSYVSLLILSSIEIY